MLKVSFTPKFDSKTIMNGWIDRDWSIIQSDFYDLGDTMLAYMQQYITARVHRDGSTGNLIRSINIYHSGGFGEAHVSWGIGLMTEMDKFAPYWYLINFGGHTFASAFGLGVGGSFDGDAPDASKAGSGVGTQRFGAGDFVMFPKSIIKPMNYIEASRLKLNEEVRNIIRSLKGTSGGRTHGYGMGAGGAK